LPLGGFDGRVVLPRAGVGQRLTDEMPRTTHPWVCLARRKCDKHYQGNARQGKARERGRPSAALRTRPTQTSARPLFKEGSIHPIRGDEMRALRKLRRDYPTHAHVFVSERGGPISHRFPPTHPSPRGGRRDAIPDPPAHASPCLRVQAGFAQFAVTQCMACHGDSQIARITAPIVGVKSCNRYASSACWYEGCLVSLWPCSSRRQETRHGRQPGGANASVGGSSLAIGSSRRPDWFRR
jgi:hypothetical protein